MQIENFTIEYDSMELAAIKLMAHIRSDHKIVPDNKKNYKNGIDQSYYEKSLRAHYYGVAGEYAVAKITNGFFDPLPKPNGDNNAADVVAEIDGSLRISVKTTGFDPPIFKIKSLEELNDSTSIALCYFKEPFLTIKWLKDKEHFLRDFFERDFGYGYCYCSY